MTAGSEQRGALFAPLSYVYFVMGVLLTAIGPALPALQRDFGLSMTRAGLVFTVRAVGFLIAVVGGGLLCDRFGRRKVVLGGLALYSLPLMLLRWCNSWGLALTWFFLAAAGFGFSEVSINAIVMDDSGSKGGRALNLLHVFPAVGAICGGPLATWVISAHRWQDTYLFCGLLLAVGVVMLGKKEFPQARPGGCQTKQGLLRMAMRTDVAALAVVMMLYVGLEETLSGWSYTYLLREGGASRWLAGMSPSVFWAGLLTSRLVAGVLSDSIGYLPTLLGAGGGGAVAVILMASSTRAAMGLVLLFLSGAFLGCTFPTVLAEAGRRYPRLRGTVSGLLIGGCSLGSATIPVIVAAFGDRASLRLGLLASSLAAVLMAAICLALLSTERRQQPAESIECQGKTV